MGASLDTPADCPVCKQKKSELVILECKHQFCQRCIEDLWSATPDGPYYCPESRCKREFRTLPFNRTSRPRKSSSRRRGAQPSNTAGSLNNDQSTPDSALRRPSLTHRLLGKRKASVPAAEQPDTKRSTVEAPPEQCGDVEGPSCSYSDSSGPELSQTSESQESKCEDGLSSSHISVSVEPSDVVNDASDEQGAPVEFVLLDDSDSLDEVIICEAPPDGSPQRDPGEEPAAPTSANPSAGVPPDTPRSPLHPVNKSPFTANTQLPSTPGSSDCFPRLPKVEIKSASPVPCNYCPNDSYLPAVRTCLVCGASMCSQHLRPHLESPVFQNHTLISPVKDISSWRCQEHHEIKRIYCRQCAVCVCTVCTVIGSHRHHECMSIKEAERELRENLKNEITQLQQTEEKANIRLIELTQMEESATVVLCEARESVLQQYAAIREALDEEEQTALCCVKKEESRVLEGLGEKLDRLKNFLQSIQQSLHILEGLADNKRDKHIGDQAFVMDYSKTARLAGAMGSYMEQLEAPEEVNQARLEYLQRWTEKRLDAVVISVLGKDRDGYRLLYGCVPSLDVNTAHPKLQLSDNNRGVTHSDTQQPYTDNIARFNSFPQVLASSALQGGQWYWEVEVSVDEGRWKVGVCEALIMRKGQQDGSRLGCNPVSWCLACDSKKVEALHNKVAEAVDVNGLQRVGVFLNFEEGVLSFFNVTPGGSLALMHSFKHGFADPVYPAFSVSKTHLAICDLYRC